MWVLHMKSSETNYCYTARAYKMYLFLSINISRIWQPLILLFLDHCCASLGEYFRMVFTTPQRIKIVSFYLETRSVVGLQTQRRYGLWMTMKEQ